MLTWVDHRGWHIPKMCVFSFCAVIKMFFDKRACNKSQLPSRYILIYRLSKFQLLGLQGRDEAKNTKTISSVRRMANLLK